MSDLLAGIGRRSLETEPDILTVSKGKKDALQFEEQTGIIAQRVILSEAETREFERTALDDATLAANASAAAAAAAAGDDLETAIYRGGVRRHSESDLGYDQTEAAYARASISKLAYGFDDCPLPSNPFRFVPKRREKTTLFLHRPQIVREVDETAGSMNSGETVCNPRPLSARSHKARARARAQMCLIRDGPS